MKKSIIMFAMVLSGFTSAQESSDNPFIYDNGTTELKEEETFPANPGDVPIDDYIPALLVVALIFTFAYAKRKNVTAE